MSACPECGSIQIDLGGDGDFPNCRDCGFVQLDEHTLRMERETKEEYQLAKLECAPNRVPSYGAYQLGCRDADDEEHFMSRGAK